jgi:myo-inositol 2-dehydrogenase/D-chiro-inositol 1-dehydrogenase
MAKTINVGFLGAGRMGMTHLRNLVGIANVNVRIVADNVLAHALAGAEVVHAEHASDDIDSVIHTPDLDAILIATPTGTHAELIEKCVRAGKAVWCEKPVAMTLADTERVVRTVESCKMPVMIGFMRRFDPGYATAKHSIDAGELGRIERFRALSCDFTPPPLAFIKTSGGIFVDMMVHDFDMARHLVGEVESVNACGDALIDPGFTEAGDVDTCIAVLRFTSGAIGVIEGSRRTTWGYDIRTEVAGSLAKMVIEAPQKTPLLTSQNLAYRGNHYESFPDRFEHAYKAELVYFFDYLRNGLAPAPGVRDALESLRVALAAALSLRTGQTVKVSDITSQTNF